jgi:hypothetical protein
MAGGKEKILLLCLKNTIIGLVLYEDFWMETIKFSILDQIGHTHTLSAVMQKAAFPHRRFKLQEASWDLHNSTTNKK